VGTRNNSDDDTRIVKCVPVLPDEDAAERTAIQTSAESAKLIAASADDTGPTLSVRPTVAPMRMLTPSEIEGFNPGTVRTRMDTPRMDSSRAVPVPIDRSSLTPLSVAPLAMSIAPPAHFVAPLPPTPQNNPIFADTSAPPSRIPAYAWLGVGVAIGAAAMGVLFALRSLPASAPSRSNAGAPPAETNLENVAASASVSATPRPGPAPRP
jgi:hypothetical protein